MRIIENVGNQPTDSPQSINQWNFEGKRRVVSRIDMSRNPGRKRSDLLQKRRKSGATSREENDNEPHHSSGERDERSKMEEGPEGPIFEIREWPHGGNNGIGMCVLPL